MGKAILRTIIIAVAPIFALAILIAIICLFPSTLAILQVGSWLVPWLLFAAFLDWILFERARAGARLDARQTPPSSESSLSPIATDKAGLQSQQHPEAKSESQEPSRENSLLRFLLGLSVMVNVGMFGALAQIIAPLLGRGK